MGTVKAVVSETSSNTNHALGMSVLTAATSLSYILGTAVPGLLADPIGQYNLSINGNFC